MTKKEITAFIESLKKIRELATDEQAIQVPNLYPSWHEGINYKINDKIVYNNILYKVIQAHFSQGDWAPDVASSLFAKVLVSENGEIFDWEQPESTNPYMKGDKVKFDGIIYESLIDYNIYSPIDYPAGWQLIES